MIPNIPSIMLFWKNRKSLLENNSGFSIKSWFLYSTFICGVIILLVAAGVLVLDVLADGSLDGALSGFAEVILAVSTLFVAAGLPKIAGEFMESRMESKTEDEKES